MCEFLVHNYVILAIFRPPNGDVESNTKADIIHQCMTYAIKCAYIQFMYTCLSTCQYTL